MYIGLDVHKKLSYYSMVDGKTVEKLKEIKWYERTLPLIIAIFNQIIAIIIALLK